MQLSLEKVPGIFISFNLFTSDDFKETEDLRVLREVIEESRILFTEWVKVFDQWNYICPMRIFIPSGVNYEDPDPDKKIFLMITHSI